MLTELIFALLSVILLCRILYGIILKIKDIRWLRAKGMTFREYFDEKQFKGKVAEYGVSDRLKRMGTDYKVFDDIMIRCQWGTSQIDHIVVSKYGIFVIETKNYQGKIYGADKSENWKQYIHGNEYRMVNPVRQNQGHVRALMECLPTYNQFQYVSVVAFAGDANVKTNCQNVVYVYELTKYISNRKNEILTEKQVDEYCNKLNELNILSEEERKKHNVNVEHNNYLKEHGTSFRSI